MNNNEDFKLTKEEIYVTTYSAAITGLLANATGHTKTPSKIVEEATIIAQKSALEWNPSIQDAKAKNEKCKFCGQDRDGPLGDDPTCEVAHYAPFGKTSKPGKK